jgi:pseudouridine synthase, RluA family
MTKKAYNVFVCLEEMALEDRLAYIVPPEYENAEVLTLLRRELRLSTALLRRLKCVPEGILLDGSHVTVRARVKPGQTLSILREPPAGERRVEPQNGPLRIVYEDVDLLILDKPVGLAVHPSPGHTGDTLANYVAAYLDGKAAFHAVNRLDRGTGGLMCVAKNKLAAQRLALQLQGGELHRAYRAVVDGVGLLDHGVIDLPIGRVEGNGIRRQILADGQSAVTRYARLAEGHSRTLLRLELETGRTHQIRVHMAHLGHPVTGDFLYGTELSWLDGFALCSAELHLHQPSTDVFLSFSISEPDWFTRLLDESI